ncbi:MAG: hypothetical protein AAF235_03500 [Planctomycetota bacterium]
MRRVVIVSPQFGPQRPNARFDERSAAMEAAGVFAEGIAAEHVAHSRLVDVITPLPESFAPSHAVRGQLALHHVGVHPGRADAAACVEIARRLSEVCARHAIDHIEVVSDRALMHWVRLACTLAREPERPSPNIAFHSIGSDPHPAARLDATADSHPPVSAASATEAWRDLERIGTMPEPTA